MHAICRLTVLLTLSLCLGAAYGQQKPLSTVTPEKPSIGERITITYLSTHPKARLLGAKGVMLEGMVLREGADPLAIDLPMQLDKKSDLWTVVVPVNDAKARLLAYRFASGDKVDDNGGTVWHVMFHQKGVPMMGAHLAIAQMYRSGGYGDLVVPRDLAKARAELAEEKRIFPNDWRVSTMEWSMAMRDPNAPPDTRDRIKGELEALYASVKSNEDAVADLLPWFEQTNQKDRASGIRAEWIAKDPSGKIAETSARRDAYSERDKEKRADLLLAFVNRFPNASNIMDAQSAYIGALVDTRQFGKAVSFVKSIPRPSGAMWIRIADGLADADTALDEAVQCAFYGTRALRVREIASKPDWMPIRTWEEQRKMQLVQALATQARILKKQGKVKEGLPLLAEAYRLSGGDDEDVTEAFLSLLVETGQSDKAVLEGIGAVRKGKAGAKIEEAMKSAWIKTKGSVAGFDEAVAGARNEATADLRKKLAAERLGKPAIDFSLKALDGSTVTLSALKGKIVVIDFWATWCGPCKASFPTLQTVWEKYRNNDRVKIYAIDTWENAKGDAREEAVKKFIADNTYTFPVLFDTDVVDSYGVKGIPTKFIIDPEGNIAWQTIGFETADGMMTELTTQLDLLLSEKSAN